MANQSPTVFVTSAVAAVLIAIGFTLNVISVSTDHWYSVPFSPTHFGLWRICNPNCVFITATELGGLPAWWNVARAFSIMAMILTALGTAPLVVLATVLQRPISSVAAMIFAMLGPLFLAFGMFAWIGGRRSDLTGVEYGWSYALGWVGVGFYILGAVALGIQNVSVLEDDDERSV